MAKRAYYQISMGGTDVSSRFRPLLQELNINLSDSETSSTCDMTLDDTNAQIELPQDGAQCTVQLGWEEGGMSVTFEGKVDDIKSSGARGSGSTIKITAKSLDTKSKAKQQNEKHTDKKKLKEAAKALSKDSDIDEVKVDQSFDSIERPYWALQNESFIHWGTRIAREIGANFVVNGKTAAFQKRGGDNSVSGKAMQSITVSPGDNLINWDISPLLGRPRFQKTRARWFDSKEAKWKEKEVEVQDQGATARHTNKASQADEDHAKGQADSDKEDSKRNKGEGSVDIDGDASAQPGASCMVQGVRPGVDGQYKISSVKHTINRSSGWTTTLELKQPGDDTGKDSRGKKSSSSSGKSGAGQSSSSDTLPAAMGEIE